MGSLGRQRNLAIPASIHPFGSGQPTGKLHARPQINSIMSNSNGLAVEDRRKTTPGGQEKATEFASVAGLEDSRRTPGGQEEDTGFWSAAGQEEDNKRTARTEVSGARPKTLARCGQCLFN